MIEELKLKEDVIYDVYDRKKMGYVLTDIMTGSIGMVGARSREEALKKAREKYSDDSYFSKVKSKDIIVILRSEVNYKPAKHPLTVRELNGWMGGLSGVTARSDKIIAKNKSMLEEGS